ncbi:hypothetical protein ACT691_00965 [Vibrio metschnikovii]
MCSLALLVAILAKTPLGQAESMMLEGVQRVAIPLIATIGFLFMSTVIRNVGVVDIVANWFDPALNYAPIGNVVSVSDCWFDHSIKRSISSDCDYHF